MAKRSYSCDIEFSESAYRSMVHTVTVKEQKQHKVLHLDERLQEPNQTREMCNKKTLLDKAKDCLRSGIVVVLSTWLGSLCASRQLEQELRTFTTDKRSVLRHDCVLYEEPVDRVVEQIEGKHQANGRSLLVVMVEEYNGPELDSFRKALRARLPNVNFWPETVSRHGHKSPDVGKNRTPDRTLDHTGDGHNRRQEPKDCKQCGTEIARILQELFAEDTLLNYSDIFVLLRGDICLTDDRTPDSAGKVRPSAGIVQGLRHAGIPVRVVGAENRDAIVKMALPSESRLNEVTVTLEHLVRGLTRRVVVWVGKEKGDYYDVYDKLYASTRTSDKLVWVVAKEYVSDDDMDDEDDDNDDVSE